MDDQKAIDLKSEILKRYGVVRRAYDYHLYTAKGVRILDLYQESGGAILGWRSGKAKLAFKNTLDRGITGSFPTEIEAELVRAVQEVLPYYSTVRWYETKEKARLACASYLGLWSDIPLIESPLLHVEASIDMGPGGDSPLSSAKQIYGIPIWRPWLDEAFYTMSDRLDSVFLQKANDTLNTMVLASPYPFAGGCTVAVFASLDQESSGDGVSGLKTPVPPPSDSISPALLAAVARSFCDLSAALLERTESDWSRYDKYIGTFWDRRGPYLVPKMRKSRYPDFFHKCLDNGILISPEYDIPSIIPYIADSGEFKSLASGGAS